MQQEILKGIEEEGLAVGKRLLGTWYSAKRQQSAPSLFNRCREALVSHHPCFRPLPWPLHQDLSHPSPLDWHHLADQAVASGLGYWPWTSEQPARRQK